MSDTPTIATPIPNRDKAMEMAHELHTEFSDTYGTVEDYAKIIRRHLPAPASISPPVSKWTDAHGLARFTNKSGASPAPASPPPTPVVTHAIKRTSPMGEDFVGMCWQCGKEGLKAGDALKPCPNPGGAKPNDALLVAISGDIPTPPTPAATGLPGEPYVLLSDSTEDPNDDYGKTYSFRADCIRQPSIKPPSPGAADASGGAVNRDRSPNVPGLPGDDEVEKWVSTNLAAFHRRDGIWMCIEWLRSRPAPATPAQPAAKVDAEPNCKRCADLGVVGHGGIWRDCSCKTGAPVTVDAAKVGELEKWVKGIEKTNAALTNELAELHRQLDKPVEVSKIGDAATQGLVKELAKLRARNGEAMNLLQMVLPELKCGTGCQCQGERDCHLKVIRGRIETLARNAPEQDLLKDPSPTLTENQA